MLLNIEQRVKGICVLIFHHHLITVYFYQVETSSKQAQSQPAFIENRPLFTDPNNDIIQCWTFSFDRYKPSDDVMRRLAQGIQVLVSWCCVPVRLQVMWSPRSPRCPDTSMFSMRDFPLDTSGSAFHTYITKHCVILGEATLTRTNAHTHSHYMQMSCALVINK